ncbi:hypothetical protein Tco_0981417, partial [Tanacetum coccineum]
VMAAPVIYVSSDSSDESVGSVMPRVILFGTILIETLVVPADLHLASEVTTAVVGSPAGVLEPESHSSSETGPSESPLPPVPVAPMVSPFLCSDDSESVPAVVLPERHVSFAAHDAMVGRWRSRVMSRPSAPSESSSYSASSIEIPIVSPYQHILLSLQLPISSHILMHRQDLVDDQLKRVGPLPYHRLALRYTSHHSSSDDFTLDSLPDSLLDSSSDSSSDHSLSDHPLSDHSPKDSIEEDIDVGVPVDVGSGTDIGVIIETDEGIGLDVAMQQLYDHMRDIHVDRIASIETGHRQLEADSVIASAERAGLSSRVAVLERSNTRLRETLRVESVRADRLQRHLSFVKDELRLIRRSRYYERMRLNLRHLLRDVWAFVLRVAFPRAVYGL